MAISPIQLLQPQVPNSLTALLQGSGSALTNALNNAVQLGRDSVNNQVQQERSFLNERRQEINLAQRRGENALQQFNTNRNFNEQVRQFDAIDSDRDASRLLQAERNAVLNDATRASTLWSNTQRSAFEAEAPLREREREARLAESNARIEMLPEKLALEKKRLDADLLRIENEGNKLAKDDTERTLISGLTQQFRDTTSAYDTALADAEKLQGAEREAAILKAQQDYNSGVENFQTATVGGGLSPQASTLLQGLVNTTLTNKGILPSADARREAVVNAKAQQTLMEDLSNPAYFGAGVEGELDRILVEGEDSFADNFRKVSADGKALTETKIREIREKRRATHRAARELGTSGIEQLRNRSVSQSGNARSLFEKLRSR